MSIELAKEMYKLNPSNANKDNLVVAGNIARGTANLK